MLVSDDVDIFNSDRLYPAVSRRRLYVPRLGAPSHLFHRLLGDFRRKYIRRSVAVRGRRTVSDRRLRLLLSDLHSRPCTGAAHLRHGAGGGVRRPSRVAVVVFLPPDFKVPSGLSSTSICSREILRDIFERIFGDLGLTSDSRADPRKVKKCRGHIYFFYIGYLHRTRRWFSYITLVVNRPVLSCRPRRPSRVANPDLSSTKRRGSTVNHLYPDTGCSDQAEW